MCDVDLPTNQWAWIEEENQHRTSGSLGQSIVEAKKVRGECKEMGFYFRNLNNGRQCESSYQCRSMYCEKGLCVGQAMGTVCGGHDDCNNNLFCKLGTGTQVFSVCSPLVTLNEL